MGQIFDEDEVDVPVREKKPGLFSKLFKSPKKAKDKGEQEQKPLPDKGSKEIAAERAKEVTKLDHLEAVESKKIYTQEESDKIYNAKTMEQNVFLYTNVGIWKAVQEQLSSFEGIKCFGTSDLMGLEQAYRKTNLCPTILLIITEKNEVVPIVNFVKSLNLASLNDGQLKIYILKDPKVDTASLSSIPNASAFTAIYKCPADGITTKVINSVATVVINRQPQYNEKKEVKVPERASINKNKSFLGLNMNIAQERVQKAQSLPIDSVTMGEVRQQISSLVSGTAGLEELKKSVPSIRAMAELEDEIQHLLEKSKYKSGTQEEINSLIEMKLFVATTETVEIKKFMEELIKKAQDSIKEQQSTLYEIDPEELDKLSQMQVSADVMLAKRDELRKKVEAPIKEFQQQASMINKCIALQDARCNEIQSQCRVLLLDKQGSAQTQGSTKFLLQHLQKMRNDLAEQRNATVEAYKTGYELACEILKHQNELIRFDDAIFSAMTAINEEKDRIIASRKQLVTNVDTRLKERGTLIYKVPGSGLRRVFKEIITNEDLIINIGRYSTPEGLGLNGKVITAKEFCETDLDSYRKQEEIVEIQVNLNEGLDESFINRVDYVSGYFKNVFIIIDIPRVTDESNAEREIQRAIARVVYWTDMVEEKMLAINAVRTQISGISNIVIEKVVFNKVTSEQKANREMFRTQAGLSNAVADIIIPFAKVLQTDAELASNVKTNLMRLKTGIGTRY